MSGTTIRTGICCCCESHPHKGRINSKLKSKTIPVLPTPDPILIFPFHLLPSPVHSTGFSFCFFPGNALPFSSCCRRTPTTN